MKPGSDQVTVKEKMYPKREPFKTMFKLFSFFGFWNEIPKWHKRIAMFVLFSCTVGYSIMILLSLFQANKLSDILDGVKILPILITIVISLYGFILKKSKVQDLLEVLEEMEEADPESKPYFDEAYGMVKNILLSEVMFVVLLFLTYVSTPLILKKLIFPAYIPDIINDYEATFYVYWIYQSLSGLYTAVSHTPVIDFRCSLLIVFNGYMKYFCDKLRSLASTKDNFQEAKDQLVKCLIIHQRIKKLVVFRK